MAAAVTAATTDTTANEIVILKDVTCSAATTIDAQDTLTVATDTTLTIDQNATLTLSGTLTNTGTITGAGAVNLQPETVYPTLPHSNVKMFSVNDQASYEKLPEAYLTDYPWTTDAAFTATLPRVAATFSCQAIDSSKISIKQGNEAAIEEAGIETTANETAFFSINNTGNTGLAAGEYVTTLTVVKNGVSYVVTGTVSAYTPAPPAE